MVSNPVYLSGIGPADQQLPEVDPRWQADLDSALSTSEMQCRAAVCDVVAKYPTYLEGWAVLGEVSILPIDKYMAFRVGYHRGLDALRANGWRGSGYVRWTHRSNLGFLRCLRGLADMARLIGETDEAERCDQFLLQLDPNGIPTP